jgi:hypothetical protein
MQVNNRFSRWVVDEENQRIDESENRRIRIESGKKDEGEKQQMMVGGRDRGREGEGGFKRKNEFITHRTIRNTHPKFGASCCCGCCGYVGALNLRIGVSRGRGRRSSRRRTNQK